VPDSNLLTYATEKQAEYIQAVIDHGSGGKAAEALGVSKSGINYAIKAVKRKAAKHGYAPEYDLNHPTAPGQALKGTSTLYDQDGNQRLQWVKTNADNEAQLEAMREAVEALKEDVPRAAPVKTSPSTNDQLASVYILTDAHIGMMAWGEETGADWDVDIAEDTITGWIAAACDAAPDSETAILAQMGDLLHFDGLDSVTPESGHVLDADTRYARTVRIAIRVMRRVIDHMLTKHKTVHVMNCDANHDPSAGIWLSELIGALYENDNRVTVDQTKNTYYCFEWGNTSIYFHHGHKQKIQDISRTFAGIYREVFGRTKYSYAHLGHVHHTSAREDQLMIVETHPTLAAMDAYAARAGYNSQRGAKVITYSSEHGEISRTTIRPEMVY
jgi:hypothetical protein